jgi:hypothetical protein
MGNWHFSNWVIKDTWIIKIKEKNLEISVFRKIVDFSKNIDQNKI